MRSVKLHKPSALRRRDDRPHFSLSLVRDVNWALVGLVAVLLAYGSIVVASAVSDKESAASMMSRQYLGMGLGVVLMLFFFLFDHRRWRDLAWPLFAFDAFLILSPLVPFLSDSAKGANSWLQIAGIRLFQPSEPAKLVTIIFLAAIISAYGGRIATLRDYLKIAGLSFVPLVLILLQPDLGTGMVFVAIALGMLWAGGAKLRWILTTVAIGLTLASALLWVDGYIDQRAGEDKLIKDYQKDRLLVFLDNERDPRGAGYNLKQSKIAIGSGGLTGKGLGGGTQSSLNFLPERHTDFIFAVLGEELGFVGAIVLLGLYLALMMVALNIAVSAESLFGTLVGVGIISMWLFQILENIGMTIGLMPITGIPLPFMSYGSSFMITNLAAIGLLLAIWRQRPYRSNAQGV